jgi:hypothetical protein
LADIEEVAKTNKKVTKHEQRTLGTEQVAKEAKETGKKAARKIAPAEVVINPDAHLPAVFDADLEQVGIALPEPEPYLEIPDGLSYTEWVAAREQFKPLAAHLDAGRDVIGRYDDSIMWRIGDFLNYGEDMHDKGVEGYAEKFEDSLDGSDFGYSHDTIRKAMWVSKKIPPRERFKAPVRWKHHEAVAKLDAGDRKRWLLRVQKEGWSVAQLNQEMKGPMKKTEKQPAKTVEPVDFTPAELEQSCEVIYNLYDYVADIAKAREKDADAEIDFAELDKRARAAAHVVSAILVGIGEALKESEAA